MAAADGSIVSPSDAVVNTPTDAAAKDAGPLDGGDTGSVDATSIQPPSYTQAPGGRTSYDLLGKMYGEWICGVLPQANGQVILVGWANTEWVSTMDTWAYNAFTLVRLNADGKVDPTFGTAGKTAVTPTTHTLNACRAAVQTKDGKILAAGDAIANTSGLKARNDDFVVARFNQDGTLDTTFGAGGFASTDFHPIPDVQGKKDTLASLAQLDDGRILVSGNTSVEEAPALTYPALARYTADGAPDPTFGTAGVVTFNTTALPGAPATLLKNVGLNSTASAVVVEPDGATVVGLSVYGNISGYGMALFRLKPDGTPDTGFATGGSRWEATESPKSIFELAQLSRDADGKVVALARYYSGMFWLYRFTAQGQPDPTFATAGIFSQATPALDMPRALFMLRPADGGFLIGLGTNGGNYGAFGLLRLSPDGASDDAFGMPSWNWETGPSTTQVPRITAGALFPNGDLMVAGDITTKNTTNTDTIALRLKQSTGL
jgi:uncharacterized delta-60 repeat protein